MEDKKKKKEEKKKREASQKVTKITSGWFSINRCHLSATSSLTAFIVIRKIEINYRYSCVLAKYLLVFIEFCLTLFFRCQNRKSKVCNPLEFLTFTLLHMI